MQIPSSRDWKPPWCLRDHVEALLPWPACSDPVLRSAAVPLSLAFALLGCLSPLKVARSSQCIVGLKLIICSCETRHCVSECSSLAQRSAQRGSGPRARANARRRCEDSAGGAAAEAPRAAGAAGPKRKSRLLLTPTRRERR